MIPFAFENFQQFPAAISDIQSFVSARYAAAQKRAAYLFAGGNKNIIFHGSRRVQTSIDVEAGIDERFARLYGIWTLSPICTMHFI